MSTFTQASSPDPWPGFSPGLPSTDPVPHLRDHASILPHRGRGPQDSRCLVDDRRLQTESFEAAHQGFWRLLEDAGKRPDVLGADGEDLAVEVPTAHLDHADVALEDGGLGALALVET